MGVDAGKVTMISLGVAISIGRKIGDAEDVSTTGEGPTIYTNVYTTLTSLVKKYLLMNSFGQNKVPTLFDPENLPSSTLRII